MLFFVHSVDFFFLLWFLSDWQTTVFVTTHNGTHSQTRDTRLCWRGSCTKNVCKSQHSYIRWNWILGKSFNWKIVAVILLVFCFRFYYVLCAPLDLHAYHKHHKHHSSWMKRIRICRRQNNLISFVISLILQNMSRNRKTLFAYSPEEGQRAARSTCRCVQQCGE